MTGWYAWYVVVDNTGSQRLEQAGPCSSREEAVRKAKEDPEFSQICWVTQRQLIHAVPGISSFLPRGYPDPKCTPRGEK
jgi:hypothetical protein